MCGPKLNTKLKDISNASCKSQGTSCLSKGDASSSQTMPPSMYLYHCSYCGKDGDQFDFCFRRAKCMRHSHASDSLGNHSFSHGMNTRELNMRHHFIDGFYDSFSCGFGRAHGHALSASCVGPRHHPHGASNGSSYVFPLTGSHHFATNYCTHSFC
jgi:hypothetical protein